MKEQQIAQATSSRNLKVCDKLAQELQELKRCMQQLNYELSDLQKKCKKAWEYLARREKTTLQQPAISVDSSNESDSGDVREDQVFQ